MSGEGGVVVVGDISVGGGGGGGEEEGMVGVNGTVGLFGAGSIQI
jgi:hypothetical protein